MPISNHLPPGSVVGTSSLRRESQLRARFPHLKVESLRGNVQTRLRKLDEGQYAAIILAAAGLKRLGLDDRIRDLISPKDSLPAVGQGALGIECLTSRPDLEVLLRPLHHADTAICVRAERALSRALAGSCQVPLGGFAEIVGNELHLRGFVGQPGWYAHGTCRTMLVQLPIQKHWVMLWRNHYGRRVQMRFLRLYETRHHDTKIQFIFGGHSPFQIILSYCIFVSFI